MTVIWFKTKQKVKTHEIMWTFLCQHTDSHTTFSREEVHQLGSVMKLQSRPWLEFRTSVWLHKAVGHNPIPYVHYWTSAYNQVLESKTSFWRRHNSYTLINHSNPITTRWLWPTLKYSTGMGWQLLCGLDTLHFYCETMIMNMYY